MPDFNPADFTAANLERLAQADEPFRIIYREYQEAREHYNAMDRQAWETRGRADAAWEYAYQAARTGVTYAEADVSRTFRTLQFMVAEANEQAALSAQ